jgi:TolB-like protein
MEFERIGRMKLYNHRIFGGLLICILLGFASAAVSREKITVAVLDFEGKNVSRENAEALTDLLRTELFNTGCFKVIERQQIQKILEEQKFQLSGVTDADQAAEIGRLLNVKKIMIGTVTRLGGTHIINTRIVDVQSGQVELAEAVESKGGDEMLPGAVTELALKVSYKIGVEGSIIRISGETLYIDLGSADGLKIGQKFDVIRQGEAITDLEGRVIGTNFENIGSLMITKVQERFSEAVVNHQIKLPRRGDKVRPSSEEPKQYNPPQKEPYKKPEIQRPAEKETKPEVPVIF